MTTITFTLMSIDKVGQARYERAGYPGAVFMSKRCLCGPAPPALSLISDGLRFAPPTTAADSLATTAARQARHAARASRIAALADKRRTRAERLRAKLGKLEALMTGEKPRQARRPSRTPHTACPTTPTTAPALTTPPQPTIQDVSFDVLEEL